jgi:hypothetical protein
MKWFKAWLIKLIDERIRENDFVLESRHKVIEVLDKCVDTEVKVTRFIKLEKENK